MCTVSNLHWIVISTLLLARLEVFQCLERENTREIEEKRKKKTTKFGGILSKSIGLRQPEKLSPDSSTEPSLLRWC